MTGKTIQKSRPAVAAAGFNLPVFRACEILGGVLRAADTIGTSGAQMSRYRSGHLLPGEPVGRALERATDGQVTWDEIARANKRIEAARLLDRAGKLLAESAVS